MKGDKDKPLEGEYIPKGEPAEYIYMKGGSIHMENVDLTKFADGFSDGEVWVEGVFKGPESPTPTYDEMVRKEVKKLADAIDDHMVRMFLEGEKAEGPDFKKFGVLTMDDVSDAFASKNQKVKKEDEE